MSYLLVSSGAAVAAWLGARRHGPAGGARWLAVALTLDAVGDLVWQVQDWLTGSTPDVSPADVVYLGSYVALGAALVGHTGMGTTSSRDRLHALLDSSAVLVAALLVVWQASIGTTLADDTLPLASKVVLPAYPVLDVLAVGLVVRAVVLRARLDLQAVLLALGAAAWTASDLDWLLLASADEIGDWLSAGWLVGAVALGGAAWAARPARPALPAPDSVIGHWRITCAFLPLLVPGAIEFDAWLNGTDIDPLPGLLATLTLTALVVVRAQRLLGESARSRSEVRSLARRYEALAVNSSDAVAVVDPDGLLTADSSSLAELLGQPGLAGLAEQLGQRRGVRGQHPGGVDDGHRVGGVHGQRLVAAGQ